MPKPGRLAELRLVLCAAALAPLGMPGAAATAIYSCIDATGKKLTSDRPIVECANRDQQLLNADGSVRRIVPPTPTADERADAELAARRAVAERTAQQDAVRRDRNLMLRFPNETAHQKARASALDDVRKAIRASEDRLALLAAERKPMLDEAEFYVGRELPAKLRQSLDGNEVAVEAQRTLVQNQQAEVGRINDLFDVELERLKRLWGGAQPGSMGALPVATPATGTDPKPLAGNAAVPRKAASQ